MRNSSAERRTAVGAAAIFVVLVILCLALLRAVDPKGFESVTNALSGVAGIAGALVAIVLAVVALMVARTAEISQSPEYQSAFRAYRSVWELDSLASSIAVSPEMRIDPQLKQRAVDVACSADFLMFLNVSEKNSSGKAGAGWRVKGHQLRRNLFGSDDERFKAAVEELRVLAIEALDGLQAEQAGSHPRTFRDFVRKVVVSVGMPPGPEGGSA